MGGSHGAGCRGSLASGSQVRLQESRPGCGQGAVCPVGQFCSVLKTQILTPPMVL